MVCTMQCFLVTALPMVLTLQLRLLYVPSYTRYVALRLPCVYLGLCPMMFALCV